MRIETFQTALYEHLSMWDPHFAYLYLVAGVFALVPVFLISFPYLREWASQTRGHRPLWCGLTAAAAGTVILAATFVEDWIAGRTIVFDAIGKAVAAFALLVGLTMGALWLWYRRARLARR